MGGLYSGNALAQELGVSQPTISKWALKGIISKLPNGKFDISTVRRELAEKKPNRFKRDSGAPSQPPPKSEEGESEYDVDIRLKVAKADMAEAKLAEYRGTLVEATLVERHWFTIARNVRDTLLAVPDRVAERIQSLLGTLGDGQFHAIKQLVRAEVLEAAAQIQNSSALAPGAGAAGDDEEGDADV